jgi:hypothetical protein
MQDDLVMALLIGMYGQDLFRAREAKMGRMLARGV